MVDLFDVVPGVGERRGEIPIIGHEQRATGVEIEPPHGHQTHSHVCDQTGHRRAAFGIVHRAHDPSRLMEQKVNQRLRTDPAPINLDLGSSVDLGAKLGDDPTIHPHPTADNQRLCLAPRGDPGAGQHFLQSFFHRFRS